jgi:hypothetical protein
LGNDALIGAAIAIDWRSYLDALAPATPGGMVPMQPRPQDYGMNMLLG